MVKTSKKSSLKDDEPGGRGYDSERIILKGVEKVTICGEDFLCRIDSGAMRSSVCGSLVQKFKIGPIIKKVRIKSANGEELRDLVNLSIKLAGKDFSDEFSVANRRHMEFPVLIGRDILKRGFLIDISK